MRLVDISSSILHLGSFAIAFIYKVRSQTAKLAHDQTIFVASERDLVSERKSEKECKESVH